MFKVLVTGARNWNKPGVIERELRKLVARHGDRHLFVIQGKAPGADQESEVICEKLNVHCAAVKALWNTRHNSAGPQRNRAMFDALQPDLVLAFHENLTESKGTKDMVGYARSKGAKVKVVKK
jgi:hypothetical protein